MMVIYQREPCSYCKNVREKLTELLIPYVSINVPKDRNMRKEMEAITGTVFIPALIDKGNVLAGRLEENSHILDYLECQYANKSPKVSGE